MTTIRQQQQGKTDGDNNGDGDGDPLELPLPLPPRTDAVPLGDGDGDDSDDDDRHHPCMPAHNHHDGDGNVSPLYMILKWTITMFVVRLMLNRVFTGSDRNNGNCSEICLTANDNAMFAPVPDVLAVAVSLVSGLVFTSATFAPYPYDQQGGWFGTARIIFFEVVCGLSYLLVMYVALTLTLEY